jgi:hypothetical protein
VVLGVEIERMSDLELGEVAEKASLLARTTPAHKERVIAVVLGGEISVDSAVDIAKEAADVIRLEKNLLVLADGVAASPSVLAARGGDRARLHGPHADREGLAAAPPLAVGGRAARSWVAICRSAERQDGASVWSTRCSTPEVGRIGSKCSTLQS